VLGAPEKHKKNTKKKEISIFGKMKLRPPDLDSLRPSGPAKSHTIFFFQLPFQKNLGAGM
jgi:hypothetical protein